MASLWGVACCFALITLAIFYIKKACLLQIKHAIQYGTKPRFHLHLLFALAITLNKLNWASNIENFTNAASASPIRQYRKLPWADRQMWVVLTAPFNNMRTLKFKAQPTNVFFATVNQMFGGSSQLTTVLSELCSTI